MGAASDEPAVWGDCGVKGPIRYVPVVNFRPAMEKEEIRPRVVIAEDFVLIQEHMRQVLLPDCDVVATAEDGDAALQAVAVHTPDILVMDISLPGLSGFAVAEKLNREHPNVAVIFVTAHSGRDYVERAFEIGVKGYVLKRAMRTELPAAIRDVMAGLRYRSPLAG